MGKTTFNNFFEKYKNILDINWFLETLSIGLDKYLSYKDSKGFDIKHVGVKFSFIDLTNRVDDYNFIEKILGKENAHKHFRWKIRRIKHRNKKLITEMPVFIENVKTTSRWAEVDIHNYFDILEDEYVDLPVIYDQPLTYEEWSRLVENVESDELKQHMKEEEKKKEKKRRKDVKIVSRLKHNKVKKTCRCGESITTGFTDTYENWRALVFDYEKENITLNSEFKLPTNTTLIPCPPTIMTESTQKDCIDAFYVDFGSYDNIINRVLDGSLIATLKDIHNDDEKLFEDLSLKVTQGLRVEEFELQKLKRTKMALGDNNLKLVKILLSKFNDYLK